MRRRTLLRDLGGVAAAPFAEQAEQLRVALNGAVSTEPTDRDVDAWQQVVMDYAHEVGMLPPDQLLPDLLRDGAEISSLLATATGPLRRQLMRSAALLATLTAITLTTLGDPRSSRRWWRTAGRAADESGDRHAASLVRGRQAVFSLYENRPSLSVLDVADQAIAIEGKNAGAGAASGYAAKAQVLAQLGRYSEATSALADLTRVFETLSESVKGDRTSQWGWSNQRLHHVASSVHMFTGNIEEAMLAQDAALLAYPAETYQGRSQIELHRVGCLIRSGDVSEGARQMVRVLEALPIERRMDGLLRRTAVTALSLAPPIAVNDPALLSAKELLAIASGDR